ncbi:hypothetical protein JXA34_01795 [Patescibacteria group bacterium]|nr:hypothetical protein [Patescibacteria group bacterium]
MKRKEIFTILALLFFVLVAGYFRVAAYTISFSIDIDPETTPAGTIISMVENVYKHCDEPYSRNIIGVVTADPEIALVGKTQESFVHIASLGNSPVRVTAKNGPINEGDYVTSSEIPGVGMKATESGNVIGRALESYTQEDPSQEGVIMAALDVKQVSIEANYSRNLLTLLQKGSSGVVLYPLESLRYLLAAVLVGASFILGLFSFTRIAINSVQAIGRNPVAHEYIKRETRSSFQLTTIVIIAGLAISYIILAI